MKYELNKNDWQRLINKVKDIQAKNDNDKYYIEIKRRERSYEQLKLYWLWLEAILYFIKDDIKLNTTEELHIYMKEYYCYKTNKEEYFKEFDFDNHKKLICIFSINLNDCKQDVFNEYLQFIKDNFHNLINVDIYNIDNLLELYYSKIK